MELNPKAAGIAAGGAFLVSLVLGAINASSFSLVFLRALGFGALFFFLGLAASFLFEQVLGLSLFDGPVAQGESDFDRSETARGLGAGEGGALDAFPSLAGEGGAAGEAEEKTPSFEPVLGGVEHFDNTGYTKGEEGVAAAGAPRDSGGGGFSLDIGGFVPGMPGVGGDGAAGEGSAAGEYEMGTVELSVKRKPGDKIELSDLGDNVDGKKVAQAIQTMLRKDEG
jgi:hypothetical protein